MRFLKNGDRKYCCTKTIINFIEAALVATYPGTQMLVGRYKESIMVYSLLKKDTKIKHSWVFLNCQIDGTVMFDTDITFYGKNDDIEHYNEIFDYFYRINENSQVKDIALIEQKDLGKYIDEVFEHME